MIIEPRKEFERPESGEFNGTIIDIIDLGKVKDQYGEKKKFRIVWVLGLPDGSGRYALDSEGNPFRAIRQVNASIDEKSKLYELAKSILGQAPPVPFDTEMLMGRSNRLFIEKTTDPRTNKTFANIKFITFLPAGQIAPVAPQGFVRAHLKQAQAAQPVQNARPATTTVGTTPTSQPTVPGTTVNAAF